jgi:hypothetical protein
LQVETRPERYFLVEHVQQVGQTLARARLLEEFGGWLGIAKRPRPGEERFVVTRRGQLEAVCPDVEALAVVVDIAELRPDE